MRVGIELTPLTYLLTGIGYYVRHVSQELAALMPPGDLYGFIGGIRSLEDTTSVIPYRRLPVPPRILNGMWGQMGWPHVDAWLGGVDIFHAVNYVLPPLKRARGVLSIHDLGFLREPGWSNPKAHKRLRSSIRKDALRAEAIIACSQATKEDIVAQLQVEPSRVHVIYDAADTIFVPVEREAAKRCVAERLNIRPPYLLFVSTIEARKNVIGLLDAFARAEVSHNLVIAGAPGWGSEAVMVRVEQLGLAERVLFTGYLPDRTLFPALYSAADAFVFPSLYEGFGLAVLEAMACGCPVITSNTSSLPEVGGDAPLYVEPYDVEGLACAMEQVVGDDDMRTGMRELGLAQAHTFSWRKCAEETFECYRSLV